jgi:uncharacterized repeat protein (TIGR04138 family)
VEMLEKGEKEHPLEFYVFLFETICSTSLAEKFTTGTKGKIFHLSPEKICSLFSHRMNKNFGKFSRLVMKTWGIRSSTDVGKAVFKLAEHNCLMLSGTEKLEDFTRAGLDV